MLNRFSIQGSYVFWIPNSINMQSDNLKITNQIKKKSFIIEWLTAGLLF